MRNDSRTVEWMNSVSRTVHSIESDDVELKTSFCVRCVAVNGFVSLRGHVRHKNQSLVCFRLIPVDLPCPSADFVKSRIPVHATKGYTYSRGVPPVTLKLGARWRWVVNFTTRPLYHWKSTSVTHWIGDWLCPKTCLGVLEKKNHYCRLSGFKFRTVLGTKPIRLVSFLLRIQLEVSRRIEIRP
jgi:hypothetical protein